jgi:translation initiation factor IF-1
MPIVSARSNFKNMSKAKRSAAEKNIRRVTAALNNELDLCTYGKVTKACGNRMFKVITVENNEHLAHIRGKIARININDIVLLNVRDYESRTGTEHAVFDIMASFAQNDVSKLIKKNIIPGWMVQTNNDMNDLFEDAEEYSSSDEDIDTI